MVMWPLHGYEMKCCNTDCVGSFAVVWADLHLGDCKGESLASGLSMAQPFTIR